MKSIIICACVLLFLQPVYSQQRPLSALVTVRLQSSPPAEPRFDLTPAASRKSVFWAVMASLAVPGLGEWYAGSFETGKYHLIAEGGLWMTYAGFRMHSNWVLDDARTFAREHAGANFENKSEQFSVDIGNFNTTDEYNDAKGRNREYTIMYNTGEHPEYLWTWDTDANRLRFKDMRTKSSRIKNNSKFVIGAIVVNHLFSAFSAGKKAAAYNESISLLDRVDMYAFTMQDGVSVDGWGIRITAQF